MATRCLMFGNAGFVGFPVVGALFGHEAILYAAIANIPGNLLQFSAGVSMFARFAGASGEEGRVRGWRHALAELERLVTSPTLVSSVALLLLVLAGVSDLGPVGEALSTVGQFTTPAALFIVGSSLARYPLAEMFGNWRAYLVALCRLLVIPLASMVALGPLGLDGVMLGVVVVVSGMPVVTSGTLYCLRYGVDVEPMIQATFLTVVGSVASIPLVIACLG